MTIAAFVKHWGVLALGVALVISGMVIAGSQPVSFGWFAYAPLSNSTYMPAFSPVVAMPTEAAALLAIGAVLVAGWAGFRLGKRSAPER